MDDAKLALFGGTFDPIHLGHLIVARSVLEQLDLQRVVLIPSARPPHKDREPITGVGHRLAMVRLAIENDEIFDCDDCEIQRSGPSYTYDTVGEFRRRLGSSARLCWIIGADSLAELDGWHRVNDLVEACEIVTAARPGCNVLDPAQLPTRLTAAHMAKLRRGILQTPHIDIASRDIRARVACGRSVRHLVPETVRQYIHDHRLYCR